MNWKFIALMAAGMLRSAGFAKEAEDANEIGKDDVLGQGLVYAASLIEWLSTGMPDNKKPSVPEGLK